MVMYECQFFDQMKTPGTDIYNFFQANKLSIKSKKPKIMQPRLSLKGGNVTLFRVLARADKEYEICYLDINSHYPSIGIRHDFVCGKAAHLLGPNMTSRLTIDALKSCSYTMTQWTGRRVYVMALSNVLFRYRSRTIN